MIILLIVKTIISILIIINIRSIEIKHSKDFKVCLCTLGKEENNYIVEFVEYYKKYGIDKIFLYDNNDRNGERFDKVLSEYINNKFVRIINIRGKTQMQVDAFNHCNWLNYRKYNWLILFDIDEFIFLKDYNNIKDYLKNKRFDNCKAIFLNELYHTDNNQIYYQNKSVIERFPEINYNKSLVMLKTILRGRTSHIQIVNNHILHINFEGCDGKGNKKIYKDIYTQNPDYKNYFFHHYYSKSAEEFLMKIAKGSVFWGKKARSIDFNWLASYFNNNKMTEAKLNFFENRTGINLSSLREKMKK